MSRYKQHSEVRRVPLGELRVVRPHRPYLTEEELRDLLAGAVLVEEKVDGHPEVLEIGDSVYYCEDLRWKHSIEYTRVPPPMGPEAPAFWVCYDVWIEDDQRWATRHEKETLCAVVGLPVVPLVHEGQVTAATISVLAARKSSFGETQAEGVVVKNLAKGLFGKLINREFQEGLEDAEHWRRRPRVANRLAG